MSFFFVVHNPLLYSLVFSYSFAVNLSGANVLYYLPETITTPHVFVFVTRSCCVNRGQEEEKQQFQQ